MVEQKYKIEKFQGEYTRENVQVIVYEIVAHHL